MKTTLELPDPLFREAKATAARTGKTMKQFFTEALRDKLAESASAEPKPWMKGFGELRSLRKESRRIDEVIEKEFEAVDEDAWR